MREKVIKTKGRKPHKATVTKRIEKRLSEGESEKRRPGRPAKTYDERPDHIKYIIDCAALGYSPTHIVNLLKERYGPTAEEIVSLSTIQSYKKRHADEIAKREIELRAELPMMLPSIRIRVLQQVIYDATEGSPVGVDKEGNVIMRKDHGAVIQAVKELNAMMKDLDAQKTVQHHEIKTQQEVSEQKAMITEHILKIKDKTGASELEILRELAKGMSEDIEKSPELKDAIDQLTSRYEM